MRRPAIIAFLMAPSLAFLPGCETTEKALNTADRALAVAASPTARVLTTVAKASDPKSALREGLRSRKQVYAQNPYALVQDIRAVKRDYDNLVSLLRGNVGKKWGSREIRLPSRTHYIKYTQNYKSRAIVDFDAGLITVETVDDKDPRASLGNAIVTTLLTPNDPRAVDLFTDKAVTLTSEKEPYLFGLVVDQNGRPVGVPAEAERFAAHLIENRSATRTVDLEGGQRHALYVQFPLVPNFEDRQAERYRHFVAKYADQYRISPSLVYAVIKTESNFNPFAVSSAPAYGLMQLVPGSGGREAYRRAKGDDDIPTRQYLFDAENNIELGTAYLNVLTYSRLARVGSPVAREYCVISAYNTGPGNVLRVFSRDQAEAVNAINRMQPPGVYEKLRVGLPYEETRQYLIKVVNARRQYVARAD